MAQRQQPKGKARPQRRALTENAVWKAMPPVGGPAFTTEEVADRLGVLPGAVLPIASQLAAKGRAQRLYREGRSGLEWRRQ